MSELTFLQKALTNNNVKAFLLMIRKSEGTYSENGYKMMFGGGLFTSFEDHPNVRFVYTDKAGKSIITTAAGAYQITYTTWKALKIKMGFSDFNPITQDLAALELISEKDGVQLIIDGKFDEALNKVKAIWASLPGSNNNQPERKLTDVTDWYRGFGGKIVV